MLDSCIYYVCITITMNAPIVHRRSKADYKMLDAIVFRDLSASTDFQTTLVLCTNLDSVLAMAITLDAECSITQEGAATVYNL